MRGANDFAVSDDNLNAKCSGASEQFLETNAYSIDAEIAPLLRARNDILKWNVDTISPIPESQRLES